MNGKKLMFNPKLNILVGLLLTATVTIAEETDEPITELATPEIGYISDQFYVPLRSSPCPTCKIVHKGLRSGTKLSVLGRRRRMDTGNHGKRLPRLGKKPTSC
jgi:hypothetical protein